MENVNNDQLDLVHKKVYEIAQEIVAVKAHLDSVKPLYEKLDKLTLQLKEGLNILGIDEVLIPEHAVILPTGAHLAPEQYVSVVDNFAEKNTVFRPAGVKRYESHTESVVERQVKEQNLLEKAKRAGK